jgi:UPF0176 protein
MNQPISDKLIPGTPFFITSFYQFIQVEHPEQLKQELEAKARELKIVGLIILGSEGFNSTSACQNEQSLQTWKNFFMERFKLKGLNCKDSVSEKPPFLKLSVKVKPEIVTTGRTDLKLENQSQNHHLSPTQWDQLIQDEKQDVVIIDTRNWYEYNLGTFKGALNPNIEKFTDFPKYFESQKIDKDKKIMIFCTGGIRCEKGILELQEKGYKNVYQLDGGILNYLKEKPRQSFEGECFVFDNRVSVDQDLKPSQIYTLCPHCGQPAAIKKTCVRCDSEYMICESCLEIQRKKDVCSKNCSYHWQRTKKKGPQQMAPRSKF